MNIILQNTITQQYIGPSTGWTTRQGEARVFQYGIDALIFCYNSGNLNMIMLYRFTDSRMNFSIPVTDERAVQVKQCRPASNSKRN